MKVEETNGLRKQNFLKEVGLDNPCQESNIARSEGKG